MSNFLDNLRKVGTKFERPFLIRQVESHLVLGPLSRHIAFGYVFLVGGLLSLIAGSFAVHKRPAEYIGSITDGVLVFILPLMMLTWTFRQQAILGWIAVKGALGIAAFSMATFGAVTSFQRGDSDAWANLCLGLIWIPGVEFIPNVTPRQEYVTLARIALTIPCVYFGIKSGNWVW